MKNYRSMLTGVFGDPIDSNITVVMQEAAFASLGLDWRYIVLLVKKDDLSDAIKGLRAMNFAGINLTMPHKIAAVELMDELSESAGIIGAVNTVVIKEGRLIGHNTDGKGLVIGLQKEGIELKDKHVTILGAGGAARAISVECALAGASAVTIINRNQEKGQALSSLITEKNSVSIKKWIVNTY